MQRKYLKNYKAVLEKLANFLFKEKAIKIKKRFE